MYSLEYCVRTGRNPTVLLVKCPFVTSKRIKGAPRRHCFSLFLQYLETGGQAVIGLIRIFVCEFNALIKYNGDAFITCKCIVTSYNVLKVSLISLQFKKILHNLTNYFVKTFLCGERDYWIYLIYITIP